MHIKDPYLFMYSCFKFVTVQCSELRLHINRLPELEISVCVLFTNTCTCSEHNEQESILCCRDGQEINQ